MESSHLPQALRPPRKLPSRRPGPPGGKRDENRRERVAGLAAAATRLYLERGLTEVTVEDIAAAAGLAKGGFYRYFTDQDELVTVIFGPLAARLIAAMRAGGEALAAADGPAALPAFYLGLAGELITALAEHREVVRLYLQECRGPARGPRRASRALAAEVEAGAVQITERARQLGLLRDLPPRVVALLVIGAVERMLIAVLDDDAVGSPAEIARTIVTIVMEGLRRPPSGEVR
jgi:AcrR family transcriptional regulator